MNNCSEEYVEELHETIGDLRQTVDNLTTVLSRRDETIDLLIKIAKRSMEWVSVKDRLPKNNRDVLVYIVCHWDEGLSGIDIGAYFSEKDAWAHADNSAYEYKPLRTEITHWMELPDKP